MPNKKLIYIALFSLVIAVLSGCGTPPPHHKHIIHAPTLQKYATAYIANYSFTYPANWSISPRGQSAQFNSNYISLKYDTGITATMAEYTSFIGTPNSNSSSNNGNISVQPYITLVEQGVDQFAQQNGLTLQNTQTNTILQNPGLLFTLASKSGGAAGQVEIGFNQGYELISTCIWQASYQNVAQQACPALIGTIVTSSGPQSSGL